MMKKVRRRLVAETYTGSNSADMLAMVQEITQYSGNSWSIKSETPEALVLLEDNPDKPIDGEWVIKPGTFVLVAPDTGIVNMLPAEKAIARYTDDDLTFMEAVGNPAVISALSAALKPELRVAAVTVPTLLGNASAMLTVPFTVPFKDASYQVQTVAVANSAVLSGLTATVLSKTAGSVVVRVQNTGLAALSGVLHVYAFRTN